MLRLLINDCKMLKRNIVTVLIFLILPSLLAVALSMAADSFFSSNSFLTKINIAVIDLDDSLGSKMALTAVKSEGYVEDVINVIELKDKNKAMDLLQKSQVQGIVIIPKGFANGLYLGENIPVELIVDEQGGAKAGLLKGFFSNAATLVTSAQSGIYTVYHMFLKVGMGAQASYNKAEQAIPKLMFQAMGRNEVLEYRKVSSLPETSTIGYYLISTAVMFVIFTGLIGARLIRKDIETGIIQRILISKIGKRVYILEKALFMALIGLLEMILVVLPASIILKIEFTFFSFQVFITAILITLMASTFCIMISIWAKTAESATAISIIGLFVICLAGGCVYPTAIMTDSLKNVSNFMFAKWAVDACEWAFAGADISKLMNYWIVMTIFVFVFAIFAVAGLERRRVRLS